MAEKFRLKIRFPRNFQGSLTCRKSATWDRRLYFPSEGRRAEDFFARKIRRLRPGLNPQSWVPEDSTLTTRPPKPPYQGVKWCGRLHPSLPSADINNSRNYSFSPLHIFMAWSSVQQSGNCNSPRIIVTRMYYKPG